MWSVLAFAKFLSRMELFGAELFAYEKWQCSLDVGGGEESDDILATAQEGKLMFSKTSCLKKVTVPIGYYGIAGAAVQKQYGALSEQ